MTYLNDCTVMTEVQSAGLSASVPPPLSAKIRNKLKYLFFRQKWNVGVIAHPIHIVAGLKGASLQSKALKDTVWMMEQEGGFKADPFITRLDQVDGDFMIYYEQLEWKKNKGRIDLAYYDGKVFHDKGISLDSPFHLSYPFVVNFEGVWGYVPEHAQSKDTSFYSLDETGTILKKSIIKRNMDSIDNTFMVFGDKLWWFATKAGPNENSDLYIYYSDGFDKPWHAHKKNPVKSDVANARPAGQPFQYGSDYFRPAQNCSSYYGESVVINRIVKLSEHEFEEVAVSEIRPVNGSRYDYGLHTISHCSGFCAIDGGRLESSLHPLLDQYSSYFR